MIFAISPQVISPRIEMSKIIDANTFSHYKKGDDLKEDFMSLRKFGSVHVETGDFIFNYCDSCGGPQLGHVEGECAVKPKLKKDAREWMEYLIKIEPECEIAVAKQI